MNDLERPNHFPLVLSSSVYPHHEAMLPERVSDAGSEASAYIPATRSKTRTPSSYESRHLLRHANGVTEAYGAWYPHVPSMPMSQSASNQFPIAEHRVQASVCHQLDSYSFRPIFWFKEFRNFSSYSIRNYWSVKPMRTRFLH